MARLRHLAVVTPDKARLVEFYKKTFRMKETMGQPESSATFLSDGYFNLAIIEKKPGADVKMGLFHFGLHVDGDDVDHLKGLGFKLEKRPAGQAEYSVTDPDGNRMDVSTEGWEWMPFREPLDGVNLRVEIKRVDAPQETAKTKVG
jgi:catechol 2,3-dioxygenase-like lactoylglutathione lyase family enzyme